MSIRWESWTMRHEYRRCNNPRCKSCPHGPYWYGYKTEEGKTKKKYFGRKNPADEPPKKAESPKQEKEHPHDAIFNKRTASAELARKILGFDGFADYAACAKRFKELAFANHPDRGGDARLFTRINTAFSYLKSLQRPR